MPDELSTEPLPCSFLEGLHVSPANERGTAGTLEPERCGLPATPKSVKLWGKPLCTYHFEQACRDQMEV